MSDRYASNSTARPRWFSSRILGLAVVIVALSTAAAFAQSGARKSARVGWASVNTLSQVESLLDALRAGLASCKWS
jgi:hypothetical protein